MKIAEHIESGKGFLLNGDATPPPPPPPPVFRRLPTMVDKACQIELHLLDPVDSIDGDPSDRPDAVRERSTAREPSTPPATTTTATTPSSRRNTTPLRRMLELEEAIEKFDECVEPELKTAEALRFQGLEPPMGVKGVKGEGGLDRGAEEDGCGVRCLYVAVQCCECVIL